MSESDDDPIPAKEETLPVQDLLCLMRIRDFLCLILTYPEEPYHDDEKFLVTWIREVSTLVKAQYGSQERLQLLVSESPLKHVKGIIPEDITEQIKNGGSIIFNKSNSKELATATSKDPPPNHVPQPILDLATRLAVRQLAQIFSPESRGNSFYWMGAHVVCLSTRNDAEKQAVVEGIKANLQSGATFGSHQIVHLSQMDEIDDASMSGYLSATSALPFMEDYEFEDLALPWGIHDASMSRLSRWENRRHRKLVLLVDGDGDKRVDLRKVLNTLPNISYSGNVVVIITTGSLALQNAELAFKVDLRIRTEDHVLPWEVFCKNVGRELVYSSSAIQRVAVQIVEECCGHLHGIVYVAELLKDVEDVQIWNQTLQKLRNSSLPSYNRAERKRFVPGNRVEDLPSVVRIRDLVHLILSYNMELGHESLLVEWINRGSKERLRHCQSESPLRHLKGIIPEDIIEQIINGGSIIFKHVPSPILGLSYRLAVAQLVEFVSVLGDRFTSRPVAWFSTRNDLEKRIVVEDIKTNFQIGKEFDTLQTIYLDQLDEEFLFFDVSMWTETDRARRWREYYEFEVLELPGRYKRYRDLILLVDGDGDKRVDLQRVYIPPYIGGSRTAFIIITTGSSILQNAELAYEVGVRIKTEDHVLPWEVFCKNVGRGLVYSSGAIQRVAVQIVEECGGHLHDIVYVAELLKDVEDVQIWNQALQKLHNWIPSCKGTDLKHDLPSLVRMRDLVHLILSCPMKLGYEHYMWRWIQRVANSRAQQGNLERLRHCLSDRPLRHVKGIIPEDITKQIMNGGSIISEHVPPPILDLSYRLAVDQLVQSLPDSYDHFQWRMPVVWFLTRNDLEKRTVTEDIKVNFQVGETFERLLIINLDWINEKFRFFEYPKWTDKTALEQRRRDGWDFEVLKLPGKDKSHRNLMLLVDGDGDKRVDFQKVDISSDGTYSKDAVVIITTGSSTLQNDKLAYKMDAIIRIEDHVLPWEVFCKNVGKELVYSSSAIQRVAVQIVEECGGHLLAIVFAAKSLKHVEDVQIWEQTLQKLRYRSPSYKLIAFKHVSEVLVNAFINIIWEDEREKPRLNQCLNAFKLKAKMSKGELFGRWFFEQLIDNEKEAEHTLRELVETAILQEIDDIFGQYIRLPEELKIILGAMSQKKSHDNLTREPSGLTEPQKIWNSHEAASKFLETFPIRSLNLSYSGIQSLPSFLPELDQLQTLSLTGCKLFNQLLPEIPQFLYIKQLYLDGTSIMDLPDSLNCPSLRRLSLGNNLNLMKIPHGFFYHMHQLQTLDLSLTSIHDLPRSFYNLQELEYFHLRDCELFLELSPNIGQLTNLIELDLHGTQITLLPADVKNLSKLNTLSLSFVGFPHGSGHENQSMPSSNCEMIPSDAFPHGSGHENQSTPSSNCEMIPSDALSGLNNLVELCIDVNSDNEWWLTNVQRVLTEINTLRELRKLDMYIPRVGGVEYLEPVLEKLSSNFRFIVGYHMPRIISRVLPAVEEKFVASNGSLRFVNGEDVPNEVMLILSKAWAFFFGPPHDHQESIPIQVEQSEPATIMHFGRV